jgi:putative ABC transport system ATP-binding protein
MASNGTLIEIEDLTKVFYTDEVETHALSGIHLTISRGEYLAMSGPSGCGKSTLLSILGLLDTPTGGKYLLNGNPVENLSFGDRSRIRNQEIGFIFQSFNLIGDLTVEENVELPLTYRAGMPSAERKRRVKEALERVNMAHRMRHYPAQLSGGQQQRVAVARALAGSPSILLADEPTGNLDSKNGEAVMHLLADLHREGSTICMVTHDPRFAKHAQREVHLFDGKVVSETELKKLGRGSGGVVMLLRELRYAIRQLCRTPGFAGLAILVMALGIGANVALFTVVRSVLMKPLPSKIRTSWSSCMNTAMTANSHSTQLPGASTRSGGNRTGALQTWRCSARRNSIWPEQATSFLKSCAEATARGICCQLLECGRHWAATLPRRTTSSPPPPRFCSAGACGSGASAAIRAF